LDQHSFADYDVHGGIKLIREYYDYYVPGQGYGDASRAIIDSWQPMMFNFSAGISYHPVAAHTLNLTINSGAVPVDPSALRQLLDADGEPLKDAVTSKPLTSYLSRERRTGIELGWSSALFTHGSRLGCACSNARNRIGRCSRPVGNYSQPCDCSSRNRIGRGSCPSSPGLTRDLLFTLTLFYLSQQNASEYTRVPYLDDLGTLRYYMRNLTLRTYGVELSFRSDHAKSLWSYSGNVSYKYVYQSDELLRERYTRQPPFLANVHLTYAPSFVQSTLSAKYVSSYLTDRFLRAEVPIGDYLNIDCTITVPLFRSYFELYGTLTNILDIRYATISPLYPDFGRQFRIGFRLRL
jgi:iron complex outermembrane receptor protein